jgi:hypothetical protein
MFMTFEWMYRRVNRFALSARGRKGCHGTEHLNCERGDPQDMN